MSGPSGRHTSALCIRLPSGRNKSKFRSNFFLHTTDTPIWTLQIRSSAGLKFVLVKCAGKPFSTPKCWPKAQRLTRVFIRMSRRWKGDPQAQKREKFIELQYESWQKQPLCINVSPRAQTLRGGEEREHTSRWKKFGQISTLVWSWAASVWAGCHEQKMRRVLAKEFSPKQLTLNFPQFLNRRMASCFHVA